MKLNAIRFFSTISCFIIVGLPMLVRAQYTAEFLRIGVGARALAMGSAFVALANDGSAPYWNPAGLTNTPRLQLTFSYVQMFENLAQHQYLGASFQLGDNLAIGASWIHLGVDGLPRYGTLPGSRFDRIVDPRLRSSGRPEGYFNDSEDAVFISFARAIDLEFSIGTGLEPTTLPARLSVGMNMKFLRHQLDTAEATAQAVDLGVIFDLLGFNSAGRLGRGLSVGMNIQNLASTSLSWNTTGNRKEDLSTHLGFGVAYREALPWLASRLTLSVDRQSDRQDDLAIGGEYSFADFLHLRGGLHGSDWSAGAGIALLHGRIDYAFVTHDLGSSHRLSGTIEF